MAGIQRKVQEAGRITIPKDTLAAAQIKSGDYLEVFLEREGTVNVLVLRPAATKCLFCRNTVFRGEYTEHHERIICKECLEEIKEMEL